MFSSDVLSSKKFEDDLREAGYLDNHAHLYMNTYTVRNEELFEVREGFPRIIELPSGLGDLKYSLLLAACQSYLTNIDNYTEAVIARGSNE